MEDTVVVIIKTAVLVDMGVVMAHLKLKTKRKMSLIIMGAVWVILETIHTINQHLISIKMPRMINLHCQVQVVKPKNNKRKMRLQLK
jgi:hypothetical protein